MPRASRTQQYSAVQVADRARPATVTVVARYDANVEVAGLKMDTAKLRAFTEQRLAGKARSSEQGIEAFFGTFLERPGEFLAETGETKRVAKSVTSRGTGLVITPDGYVVTNAHVVEPDEDDIKTAVIASVSDVVNDDMAKLCGMVEQLLPGKSVSDEAAERLKKALAEQYVKSSRFEIQRSVYTVMGYTERGGEVEVAGKKCEIRRIGKPTPGKDVAILKMEGSDFPTLELADSLEEGGVRTGANLYVLGYPGILSLDPSFSLPSRLEPTLTAGHVSGVRDMAEGFKVVQTDAAINPGNSGGPVFNENGRVIGLATFFLGDPNNGNHVAAMNFVVAVDLVREFLRELNVKPAQSEFTAQYVGALEAYERGDNRHALAMFQELNGRHPESSVIREFIARLSHGVAPAPANRPQAKAAQPGLPIDSRRHGSPALILVVIAGLAAVAIAVLVLVNREGD